MTAINRLSQRLSDLSAGERFWFWFSPAHQDCPLMIERFAVPGGWRSLLEYAQAVPLPLGTPVCLGTASVTDTGTIQLGSPSFTEGMLPMLAKWVRAMVGENAQLARLNGAQFLTISVAGVVKKIFRDDALWEGLPMLPMPGSLGAAEASLRSLSEGSTHWFWMAEGPTGPLAVVVPADEEHSASRFGEQVLSGRIRAGKAAPNIRATARRLSSGPLLLVTEDPLERLGSNSAAWLASIGEVRLVQVVDKEIKAARRIGAVLPASPLQAQLVALEKIAEGAAYAFWFTTAAKDGKPQLLLEESREALKSLAIEAGGSGETTRGQVRGAKWGVAFRARKGSADFLSQLAGWVEENRPQAPGLEALVGARLIIQDKNGDTVERFKNDAAWARLR